MRRKNVYTIGFVLRMDDSRIANNLLYEELARGNCLTGRPQLRYIKTVDACKRDLKALGIEINVWETLVLERSVMQSSKASPSLNRHLLNS